MKEFLIKRFAGRGIGFYIGLVAACLMLGFDLAYVILFPGDRNFSLLTFCMILAGVGIEIAHVLLNRKIFNFLPILSCAAYGVAFAQHLQLGLESLSDVWNNVNFIGGNAYLALTFIILFGIGLLAALVAAFMREDKKIKG